jgi:cytoskeletal protein CcmA (bactofilin family)
MGIQAWFIVIGVAVMTLIVWDGRRRKDKQRALATCDAPHQAQVVSASTASPVAVKEEPRRATHLAAVAVPGVERRETLPTERAHQGSRIGLATNISGKVIADEPVHIKGRIEGSVIAPNHAVSVTATGYVATYIEGSYVDIDGHVSGGLRANAKVTLLSGAHVEGTVDTPRMECMAGAWLRVEVARKEVRPSIALVS